MQAPEARPDAKEFCNSRANGIIKVFQWVKLCLPRSLGQNALAERAEAADFAGLNPIPSCQKDYSGSHLPHLAALVLRLPETAAGDRRLSPRGPHGLSAGR
jgi:hypothetical protein